jgi:hypothetical protein
VVRPPGLRAARRRFLGDFAHLMHVRPWEIGRLRLWEFWTLAAQIEQHHRDLTGQEVAAGG